jgi:hypothetical protein
MLILSKKSAKLRVNHIMEKTLFADSALICAVFGG